MNYFAVLYNRLIKDLSKALEELDMSDGRNSDYDRFHGHVRDLVANQFESTKRVKKEV